MNKYINKMQDIPLINIFSQREIEDYLEKGYFKIKKYPKNSIIHIDGDKCTRIEVILSGNVVVDRIDYSGNLFTITDFKEGGVLGANLLFSKKPFYPLTITSNTDTLILEIEKDFLLKLLWTNRKFLESYLEFSSTNTARLTSKLKYSVNKTIRENIINFLKVNYRKTNSLKIKLQITKKELAENFGINRTSLSRELKKMKEEGLIDFDNSSITVKDSNILN
ncbi:MAG: Crp/Fnr family transcriptional regulator [Eubacteriales bacterium]